MADEILKEFEGTWFNVLNPYYGYLKIEEYQGEHDGGECVAVIHAKHGETDPLMWWRGTWRPTAMGFEAIAGPFHWKNMALFDKPETESGPYLRFFRSQFNGWGGCNMGKLPPGDEQDAIDELEELPGWQEEKSYWKDYPSATWEESSKYVHPDRKHYGPTDPPPFGDPDEAFGKGLGTSGGAGAGKPATKPKTNSNGDGGAEDGGGKGKGDDAGKGGDGKSAGGNGNNGTKSAEGGGNAASARDGDSKDKAEGGDNADGDTDDRNAFVRGVDKATDAVDGVTGDFTKPAGDKVDELAETASDAAGKVFGKGKNK